MIKALIFDLDDTLYRELDFVYGAFYEVAKYIQEGTGLDVDMLYKKMIHTLKVQGRGKIFNEIIKEYDLSRTVGELVQVYRLAKPNLVLYEDAVELIQWAKDNHYFTGLITDGMAQVQHNKIDCLGVRNLVDAIRVTYDLGEQYSKPHTRAYEEVLAQLDIYAKEAVYIGDNPHKDFVGARKLGINTVRIVRTCGDHMHTRLDKEYEADYEITHLMQIREVIQKINAKQ